MAKPQRMKTKTIERESTIRAAVEGQRPEVGGSS